MRLILAALDETARAPGVLQTAIVLATQFDAPLVLFRSVDVPPEFPPAAATHEADALGPKLLADARYELGELAERARSRGIPTSVEVVSSSDASRAIVEAADGLGADAIVLGSHGHRLFDRLFGTNAARVADRAHCTVVVVHEPGRA